MNAFKLKIIALAAMVIDHIGAAFPQYTPLEFRVIGRLTFPIFVYLLAEGFRHTRNPKKFLLRLLAFAVVSEPFYDWAVTRTRNTSIEYGLWQVDFFNYTNIFYTLFLGGCAIVVFRWLNRVLRQRLLNDSGEWAPLFDHMALQPGQLLVTIAAALPTAGFMLLAWWLGSDYGAYGVLFVFLMYVIESPKGLMLAVFAFMSVWQHVGLLEVIVRAFRVGYILPFGWYLMIPVTLLTVPLVAFYNGERGPGLKWLFYWAYPVHLGVLVGVAFFLL